MDPPLVFQVINVNAVDVLLLRYVCFLRFRTGWFCNSCSPSSIQRLNYKRNLFCRFDLNYSVKQKVLWMSAQKRDWREQVSEREWRDRETEGDRGREREKKRERERNRRKKMKKIRRMEKKTGWKNLKQVWIKLVIEINGSIFNQDVL